MPLVFTTDPMLARVLAAELAFQATAPAPRFPQPAFDAQCAAEGLCARCMGGAIPGLDFCVNCADDVWDEARGCWTPRPLRPEPVDAFALAMAGQPYPFEEYDA